MKFQTLTCLGLVAALAGCSGGGGNPGTPQVTSPQSLHKVSGKLILSLPKVKAAAFKRSASKTRRTPSYISPDTLNAALFINGATANSGTTAACAPAPGTCTISWSANLPAPASYTFAVEIDDSANVLGEGSGTYEINPGDNGGLDPLGVNGVAASASYTVTTCPSVSTCDGTVQVADADGDDIVGSSASSVAGNLFDNTSVTITSDTAGNGSVSGTNTQPYAYYSATAASLTVGQATTTGSYAFAVTCGAPTGTFGLTAAPGAASNNVTAAELSTLNLTYPTTISTQGTQPPSFNCTANNTPNGIIDSATGTLPLQ